MASDQKFVDYILDQLSAAPDITTRKMFGEYAVYSRGKVVALICDNRLFLKPTAVGRELLRTVTEGSPFPGAKPHFLMDDGLEDRDFMAKLIRVTEEAMPLPKPKKKPTR